MTVPVKVPARGEIIESVLLKGDLSKLTPEERTTYYMKVCESVGLNPLTRPLEYITLNNKLTLYAKRDAADQLRKINGISIEIVSQDMLDGLLSIHVRASTPEGRKDEDLGVVALSDAMKGEARANTILKAVTKAKRRVTLSISGLGFLDETEVADIPASAKRPAAAANVMLPPHDPDTGEIAEPSSPAPATAAPASKAKVDPPSPEVGAAQSLEVEARHAARKGEAEFLKFYKPLDRKQKAQLAPLGEELRNLMNEAAAEAEQ